MYRIRKKMKSKLPSSSCLLGIVISEKGDQVFFICILEDVIREAK